MPYLCCGMRLMGLFYQGLMFSRQAVKRKPGVDPGAFFPTSDGIEHHPRRGLMDQGFGLEVFEGIMSHTQHNDAGIRQGSFQAFNLLNTRQTGI